MNAINPDYYKRNGLEAIDAIEAFFMHSPHLANAFKYMVRMGDKPGNSLEQDAEKAKWYIDRWVALKSKEYPGIRVDCTYSRDANDKENTIWEDK